MSIADTVFAARSTLAVVEMDAEAAIDDILGDETQQESVSTGLGLVAAAAVLLVLVWSATAVRELWRMRRDVGSDGS